jgi:hypothetical protein
MNTHDILAFAIAGEAVRQIRRGNAPWSDIFSTDVYATSSRSWPVPDFVIFDRKNEISIAGEFKPPNQTKREYLTGLGQTVAYTRDFHYAILVVPDTSDDDYPIADYLNEVLTQDVAAYLPVGLISYDPRTISSANSRFDLLHPLVTRAGEFDQSVSIEDSFWAKWRDISPQELSRFLEYLYEEGRNEDAEGTIRDRAFNRLWLDIQAGETQHWGAERRNVSNTGANKIAWGKNYRNFVSHIGWSLANGKLTNEGLDALRIVHQYGSDSRVFLDHIALAVLLAGKHLVLINAINEFQDNSGAFEEENKWLDAVENHLEDNGFLKRNPGRHQAAVRQVARGFLKAEKTLWKNLELIIPRGSAGGRVYHPRRGFIFNWSRITSLLTRT